MKPAAWVPTRWRSACRLRCFVCARMPGVLTGRCMLCLAGTDYVCGGVDGPVKRLLAGAGVLLHGMQWVQSVCVLLTRQRLGKGMCKRIEI